MDQYMAGWCERAGLVVGKVELLEQELAALPGPRLDLVLQVEHNEVERQTLFLEPRDAVTPTKGDGLTHVFYAAPARGPSSVAALLHGYANALAAYADRKPYRAQGTADIKAVRERAAAILKIADRW